MAQRRFTQRSESGLLAAVILLRFVVPLLSDKTLMDVLEVNLTDGWVVGWVGERWVTGWWIDGWMGSQFV